MLSGVTVNCWLVEFVMVTLAFGLGCFLVPPLINANVLYENMNMAKNGLPWTSAGWQGPPQRW